VGFVASHTELVLCEYKIRLGSSGHAVGSSNTLPRRTMGILPSFRSTYCCSEQLVQRTSKRCDVRSHLPIRAYTMFLIRFQSFPTCLFQFIIAATHARPVPHDPYNPSADSDRVRHPSPYIPIRVPVFAPVIWLNDIIVNVVSVGGGGGASKKKGHRPTSSAESHERIEGGSFKGGRKVD
jgi:hypothetical protein